MGKYILTKLQELRDENLVSFHVPGHKIGSIYEKLGYKQILEEIYTLDTTEIDGTDNLHNAKEVIKNSQDKTAKIFNADKTIYLVNGTTCGIEAAIMATCNPKSKIIMNRDCHQSVINACILGDLEPIYIQTQICRKTNIIQGVNVEDVIKTIDSNLDAKAIILTYPTYYGTTYDLKSICEYAHSKDMVVIIDEAHGAHLELSNRLPKSAIIQGADIIVQSTHKTLPAFTQASMLHIKGNRVDEKKILSMLRFLESSSPSYLLLNSLELAVDIYEKHGHELMENLLNTIEEFKLKFKDRENILIYNEMDKTKIFISLKDLGITGYDLDEILRRDYKIQVELSNYYGVLLICTIGNEKDDFDQFLCAIKSIVEDLSGDKNNDLDKSEDNVTKLMKLNYPDLIPQKIISPREAFYSDKKTVLLKESIGKISGEYIIPYPPGISLTSPGEIITQEVIDYILACKQYGMHVSGLKDSSLEIIEIIEK